MRFVFQTAAFLGLVVACGCTKPPAGRSDAPPAPVTVATAAKKTVPVRVHAIGSVKAVDHLSFAVEEGETFALIGSNGAGKTTTLRILLGLSRPDAGRIAIGPDGLQPSDPATRQSLGYVPQRVEFAPGRTVADVLTFFAEIRGLSRDAVERAA